MTVADGICRILDVRHTVSGSEIQMSRKVKRGRICRLEETLMYGRILPIPADESGLSDESLRKLYPTVWTSDGRSVTIPLELISRLGHSLSRSLWLITHITNRVTLSYLTDVLVSSGLFLTRSDSERAIRKLCRLKLVRMSRSNLIKTVTLNRELTNGETA